MCSSCHAAVDPPCVLRVPTASYPPQCADSCRCERRSARLRALRCVELLSALLLPPRGRPPAPPPPLRTRSLDALFGRVDARLLQEGPLSPESRRLHDRLETETRQHAAVASNLSDLKAAVAAVERGRHGGGSTTPPALPEKRAHCRFHASATAPATCLCLTIRHFRSPVRCPRPPPVPLTAAMSTASVDSQRPDTTGSVSSTSFAFQPSPVPVPKPVAPKAPSSAPRPGNLLAWGGDQDSDEDDPVSGAGATREPARCVCGMPG